MFRFKGQPAIGLAVSMTGSGDVLTLGKNLDRAMAAIESDLPLGIDVHLVADQPVVVEEAISGFTKALFEAIAIVLAVSFISLGVRAGLVVAISIPLVLGITFAAMDFLGIALQRVSLGALIIALGLLVDDAMITVEMMIAKLEEGLERVKAASFAYTSTAFPMLTGTLVTVAGFIPVGFARSSAGEYSNSLFWVVAIALIASWFVAVLFAPLLGVWLLPANVAEKKAAHGESRIGTRLRQGIVTSLHHRWIVIAATLALFVLSLLGATQLQQQFFPSSDRTELLVGLTLPQSASIEATRATVDRFEALLKDDNDIDRWSFYIGSGAIRFYLAIDVQLANDFFAQAVVVAKNVAARERVQARLERALAQQFDDVIGRVTPLEMGPPVGWPIKYRVSGDDPARVRTIAYEVANAIGTDPATREINLDWNEPVKVIKLQIDQDAARLVGVSSESLARAVRTVVSGYTVTQIRDATYLVDLIGRSQPGERNELGTLRELQIMLDNGKASPAGAGRDARVHRRLPDDLAAQAPADHHGAGRHRRGRARVDRRQAARTGNRSGAGETSRRLPHRGRRHGRGQRQGPEIARGRGAAHGVCDPHHPDAATAEFPAFVPGDQRRAARPDRDRGSDAADRHADGLHRHAGRDRARRHDHPQFGDPDRPDRAQRRRRPRPLDRDRGGDAAPHAPNPAHGSGRDPRHAADRARGVLGSHGLCGDRRACGGDAADARVPAGALRGLVPGRRPAGGSHLM